MATSAAAVWRLATGRTIPIIHQGANLTRLGTLLQSEEIIVPVSIRVGSQVLPAIIAGIHDTYLLPASITAVVDAPWLVSSLAKPTRPEWAVTRRSMPAASTVNRSPIIYAESGTTQSAGSRLVAERADGARGAVLQVADVIRHAAADGG